MTVERLLHPQGSVTLTELPGGMRRIFVAPDDSSLFVARVSCETAYSPALVAAILEVKGVAYLCDEIARDEDPRYVENFLRSSLMGYLPESAFEGRRVLDFGSGLGASTMVLRRMLPSSDFVGIELRADLADVARLRAQFYGFENVEFLLNRDAGHLPAGVGTFDFAVLSAVFEHLLPAERPALLKQIWGAIRPGGVLFVNETPERWYPLESHTTGLPLLNYLPDAVAWRLGRRLSPRVANDTSWEQMLRDGVRGGTEREIVGLLTSAGGSAVSLQPSRLGFRDHVDLWSALSMAGRPSRLKTPMRVAFKAISRIRGTDFAPGLALAIQKRV